MQRQYRKPKAAPHGAGIASPANTVAPAITGDTAGDLLTVSDGTWTGSPAFTYAWFRNGVVIAGETTNSLQTDVSWTGDTIVAIVYGGNGAGKVGAPSNSVVLQYTGPLDIISSTLPAFGNRALSKTKLGSAILTLYADITDSTQIFASDATTGVEPVSEIQSFIGSPFTHTGTLNKPFTQTGAVVDASDQVVLIDDTGVFNGQPVSGVDIPSDTVIVDKDGTTIYLSNPATGSNPSELLTFTPTSGAIELNSSTHVKTGQPVSGTNIAANTTVASISGTTLGLSHAATGAIVDGTITFTPLGRFATWDDQSDSANITGDTPDGCFWKLSTTNSIPGVNGSVGSTLLQTDYVISISEASPLTLFLVSEISVDGGRITCQFGDQDNGARVYFQVQSDSVDCLVDSGGDDYAEWYLEGDYHGLHLFVVKVTAAGVVTVAMDGVPLSIVIVDGSQIPITAMPNASLVVSSLTNEFSDDAILFEFVPCASDVSAGNILAVSQNQQAFYDTPALP